MSGCLQTSPSATNQNKISFSLLTSLDIVACVRNNMHPSSRVLRDRNPKSCRDSARPKAWDRVAENLEQESPLVAGSTHCCS